MSLLSLTKQYRGSEILDFVEDSTPSKKDLLNKLYGMEDRLKYIKNFLKYQKNKATLEHKEYSLKYKEIQQNKEHNKDFKDYIETQKIKNNILKENLKLKKKELYEQKHTFSRKVQQKQIIQENTGKEIIREINPKEKKKEGILSKASKILFMGYLLKKFLPLFKKYILPEITKYLPKLDNIKEYIMDKLSKLGDLDIIKGMITGGLLGAFLLNPVKFITKAISLSLKTSGLLFKTLTKFGTKVLSVVSKGVMGNKLSNINTPLDIDSKSKKIPNKKTKKTKYPKIKSLKGALKLLGKIARVVPYVGSIIMLVETLDYFFPNLYKKISDMFSIENIEKLGNYLKEKAKSIINFISESDLFKNLKTKIEDSLNKLGDWISKKIGNGFKYIEEKIRNIPGGETIADIIFGKTKSKIKANKKLDLMVRDGRVKDTAFIVGDNEYEFKDKSVLKTFKTNELKELVKEDSRFTKKSLKMIKEEIKNREIKAKPKASKTIQTTKEVEKPKKENRISTLKKAIETIEQQYKDKKISKDVYIKNKSIFEDMISKENIKVKDVSIDKVKKAKPIKQYKKVTKASKTIQTTKEVEKPKTKTTKTPNIKNENTKIKKLIKKYNNTNQNNTKNTKNIQNKTTLTTKNRNSLVNVLGQRESSNDYTAVNNYNYLGRYQIGALALQDLGLVKKGTKNKDLDNVNNWNIEGGKNTFLSNHLLQDNTMLRLLNLNAKYLGSYLGKDQGTKAGMLAVSHLLGAGQAKKGYGSDANGTTFKEYFNLGKNSVVENTNSGYNKSSVVKNIIKNIKETTQNNTTLSTINNVSNIKGVNYTNQNTVKDINQNSLNSLDSILSSAKEDLGVREIKGKVDNPKIREYHASTRGGEASDEVPWCSAFVNYHIKKAGFKGTNSKAAKSWKTWGLPIPFPKPGCVAVKVRKGGNHTGIVAWVDKKKGVLGLLGGNQGKFGEVKVSTYPIGVFTDFRVPGPKEGANDGTKVKGSLTQDLLSVYNNPKDVISNSINTLSNINFKDISKTISDAYDKIDKGSFKLFKDFVTSNGLVDSEGALSFQKFGLEGKTHKKRRTSFMSNVSNLFNKEKSTSFLGINSLVDTIGSKTLGLAKDVNSYINNFNTNSNPEIFNKKQSLKLKNKIQKDKQQVQVKAKRESVATLDQITKNLIQKTTKDDKNECINTNQNNIVLNNTNANNTKIVTLEDASYKDYQIGFLTNLF